MPSADPIPDPRSPSPPPQAPTPLTPGPRAQAFLQLYTSALDNTLKSIGYNSFADCFPSIAQNAPTQLQAMHSGMVNGLRGFAEKEFEDILEERRVVEGLNRLEGVIGDAKRRKARGVDGGKEGEEGVVPPHTLRPQPLVNAHLTPLYRSQQSQLNAKLQTTQSQNANLVEVLRRQRVEIEELLSLAERVVGDLDSAGQSLGKEGEVLKEAGKAEEVLSGF